MQTTILILPRFKCLMQPHYIYNCRSPRGDSAAISAPLIMPLRGAGARLRMISCESRFNLSPRVPYANPSNLTLMNDARGEEGEGETGAGG